MAQTFLTLEGAASRRLTLFDLGGIRPDEVRKAWHGDPYRETDEAEAAERSGIFKREILFKDTDEGVPANAPPLFSMYEDLMNDSDFDLGWGWKNIVRMVTPPARVRRAFTRVTQQFRVPKQFKPPKQVKNFMKKAVRYAGAVNTLPLTAFGGGAIRNRMFGLKGGEIKAFDAAAKIGRAATVAAVSIAGAPAIAGAMGKAASFALPKAKDLLAKGKGGLGVLIKDGASDGVWKLTTDAAGAVLASKMSRQTVDSEAYAAMPESTPVPVMQTPDMMESPPMPSYVAGTGSMGPGEVEYLPRRYGEVEPYDPAAVQLQPQALPFPNVYARDSQAVDDAVDSEFSSMLARVREQRADAVGTPVVAEHSVNNSSKLQNILSDYEGSGTVETKAEAEGDPAVSDKIRRLLSLEGADDFSRCRDICRTMNKQKVRRARTLGWL